MTYGPRGLADMPEANTQPDGLVGYGGHSRHCRHSCNPAIAERGAEPGTRRQLGLCAAPWLQTQPASAGKRHCPAALVGRGHANFKACVSFRAAPGWSWVGLAACNLFLFESKRFSKGRWIPSNCNSKPFKLVAWIYFDT